LRFIETSIEQAFGERRTSGLRMLELGNQEIREPDIDEDTGKEYFTNRGYEHVSVDVNGLHGAVARDLTRPEQFQDWHGAWDILTNSGTTEHVEPLEAQYECFSIIHDCVRTGGIAVHLVPDAHERDKNGAWKGHCRFYYSGEFFELLAKECEYELLANTVINGLRCAAVGKTKDAPFMDDRPGFLGSIAQRDYVRRSYYRDLYRSGRAVFRKPGLVSNVLKRIGAGRLLRLLGSK